MLTRISWFTFVLISLFFIANLQIPAAATIAHVDFDGKRLSVHADGVALGQLLSTMAEQTGVQFSYDDLVADIVIYANFDSSPLPDGIRRILSQFNHAVIYDRSGQVKYVLVLRRQGASSKSAGSQTGQLASHRQIDMDEISRTLPDQLEAPSNDISATYPDQEETTPSSEQVSWQEASGNDLAPPPEADESDIPLQGEESPTPMVDPNGTPMTGEEPLESVVNSNLAPPPPGEEPLMTEVDPNVPPPSQEPL